MALKKIDEWNCPDGIILIEGWARDGLTFADIAHNIGIAPQTLSEWRKKYPEIKEALKKGREVVDRIVENALFKRAVGYDYDETTVTEERDGKTGDLKYSTKKTITKHVPGDTTAQIFWLKNRKPDDWRSNRVVQAQAETEDMSDIEEEVFNDDDSAEKKDS